MRIFPESEPVQPENLQVVLNAFGQQPAENGQQAGNPGNDDAAQRIADQRNRQYPGRIVVAAEQPYAACDVGDQQRDAEPLPVFAENCDFQRFFRPIAFVVVMTADNGDDA